MPSKESIITVLKLLLKHQTGTSMLGKISKSNNPFRVLISTILSARAKDTVSYPISNAVFRKYPDAKSLARAKQRDVEKVIKSIGFYRNKAKNIIATAKIVQQKYGGKVPRTKSELMELPGVGSKVAGCVLVYAFGLSAIPVDTHVHRVSNRLGWVKTKTPEQTERALEQLVPRKYWTNVNELLVTHGQTICAPITPKCSICPIRKYCKHIGVKRSN
ncbi:MAG: endonuclease III [Candidatus Woesearchaeota archaeon]